MAGYSRREIERIDIVSRTVQTGSWQFCVFGHVEDDPSMWLTHRINSFLFFFDKFEARSKQEKKERKRANITRIKRREGKQRA